MSGRPHQPADVRDPWAVSAHELVDIAALMCEWDTKQSEIEVIWWSQSYTILPQTVVAEYRSHKKAKLALAHS